jgi:peroxiredoxin Q/BCP
MMRSRITRSCLAVLLFAVISAGALAGMEPGTPAPAFRLQDQNGEWHDLERYRGRWVTLYFYPKDDTPGCTTEACAFRDNIFAFEDIGATVLGVSLDDVESHAEFAEKYSLPFSLLADMEGEAAENYGVLSDYGNFQVAKRQTFLIDPEGRIARHYTSVNPSGHSEQVLADLKTLMAERS